MAVELKTSPDNDLAAAHKTICREWLSKPLTTIGKTKMCKFFNDWLEVSSALRLPVPSPSSLAATASLPLLLHSIPLSYFGVNDLVTLWILGATQSVAGQADGRRAKATGRA